MNSDFGALETLGPAGSASAGKIRRDEIEEFTAVPP
jgi:hypothetical protein